MRNININDGLAHKRVYDGTQDSEGFIWLGTENGLQRFDGRTFKTYNKQKDNLLSDVVVRVKEDSHKQLWLMFKDQSGQPFPDLGKIQVFDLMTNKIKELDELGLQWPFDYRKVKDFIPNERHEFLFVVENLDNNRIEDTYLLKSNGNFQKIDIKPSVEWLISDLICFYGHDILYTSKRITYKYNILTQTETKLTTSPRTESVVGMEEKIVNNPKEIYRSFHYDPISNTTAAYSYSKLQIIQNKQYIDIFDKRHWQEEANFIVYNYFSSKSGDKWVCTSNGLYQINIKKNNFTKILSSFNLKMDKKADHQIRNIYSDVHGTLYVNSWGGIYKLLRNDSHNNLRPLIRYKSKYYTDGMYYDGENIWMGLDKEFRIGKYDVNGKLLASFEYDKSFWAAIKSKNGSLLTASHEHILLQQKDKFTELQNSIGDKLPNCFVNQFYYTKDSSLWVASNKGLFEINTQNVPIAHYHADQINKKYRIPFSDIRAMVEDKDGIIWLCTYGNGLLKWDRNSMSFNQYTEKEGLSNNFLSSILDDNLGNLWIGSDKGLLKFNTKTSSATTYTMKDGLSNDEFNRCAFLKGIDGMLYFGGLNGINAFDPKDFIGDTITYKAPLYITNYTKYNGISGEIEDLTDELNQFHKIELQSSDKFFTLDFQLLDYRNINHVFAYQLQGYTNDWIKINEPTLRLSGIPFGTYTLKIKSLDGSLNRSSDIISIPLIVHAPFYAKWWFITLVLILLAGIFYYFIKAYLNRQMIIAEGKRLKELDNFKNQFFTNISHEFRTPLTVILGASDHLQKADQKLTEEELSKMVNLIQRNGNNLLKLINQILDLAKLENNSFKLNFVHANVVVYIKYILESFQSYAASKNIRLEFEAKEHDEINMDYEIDLLLQILHNLLINAINYSNPDGVVKIVTNVKSIDNTKYLELKVIDNGVGIPSDDLIRIFDRFYQADNINHKREVSSGIGLSLTKEFVKVLDGQISVKSELNKWTEFTVLLPIRSEAKTTHFIGADEHFELISTNNSLEPIISQNSDSKPENYSILIIEDNVDIVSYLSDCLGYMYNTYFALNGQEGIEKAFDITPDIIISDVMMPIKNGLEVLEILKSDVRTDHIPIVLLTAKADVESKLQGLRYGADAYLTKPFNREELFITLKNLIEIRIKLQQKYAQIAFSNSQETEIVQEEDQSPIYENEFITQLRTVVDKNLANASLDVEFLCKELGMSKTNLYGKLKALTGLSVVIYIRKMRLRKANELLINSQLNISQIAYEVGYNDPKFFSRLYTEEYGASPKLAREKHNTSS